VLHHSGPSNQQSLAAALSVSPRNVTGLVDALESGGFVDRRPHPSDRRATLVTLTERGADTVAEMARDRQDIAARLVEIHGYQDMFRFVFRRPRVPAGWAGFSYHQPVLSVMIVTVLSVVELVVVDVVARRWPAVRIPLLVLGIWGVTFALGLLFGMLVRPHAIGPDGIRVRSGSAVDLLLAWDDILLSHPPHADRAGEGAQRSPSTSRARPRCTCGS